jgi:septal ring-binding cell division protein DamX
VSTTPIAAELPPVPASNATHPTPLFARYRERFDDWIGGASERHFVIQLVRTKGASPAMVEDFLKNAASQADPNRLYAYERSVGGQRWVGVVYAGFENAAAAERELAALPQPLRTNQPFVRPIKQLKP